MGKIHRLYIYFKKKHKIDTHIMKLKEGPLSQTSVIFFSSNGSWTARVPLEIHKPGMDHRWNLTVSNKHRTMSVQ